jgi:hypothetical protein
MSTQQTCSAGANGKTSVRHDLTLNQSITAGFSIALNPITRSKRVNGGTADSVWICSYGPDITYSASPDPAGVTHQFTTGIVRAGEINYGNAWLDFGRQDTTGGARVVSGPWMVPDYPGAAAQFHATFGMVFAGSIAGSKNWTGILLNTNSIVGVDSTGTPANYGTGGYGLNIHGGSGTTVSPAAAVRVASYFDTGLDASAAIFTVNGTNCPSGGSAITIAQNQAIKLGTNTFLYFDGTHIKAVLAGAAPVTVV